MRQRIIKITFWIIIITIVIGCGLSFMQYSGQSIVVGWSVDEYQWLKEHYNQSIIIECEINDPYIQAIMQKVERIIEIKIEFVQEHQSQHNKATLKIDKCELNNKEGYHIPFAVTETGECFKLVEDETNKEPFNIVKKAIQHINHTQGLDNFKQEIDLKKNQQKCEVLSNKAFQDKNELKIAYDASLYPLTYSNNGKAEGVAIEELSLILSILGVKVNYVPLDKNQSFDAIALVGQEYSINKTNSYFLMDPIFVGQPSRCEKIYINKYFPSFKSVIKSNELDIKITSNDNQKIDGFIEDRRVYETKKRKAIYETYQIISGRGNAIYGASLGCINLSEAQVEAINFAIDLAGTREETLYKTTNSDHKLKMMVGIVVTIFVILCGLVVVIWRRKQRKSVEHFDQINQMMKVDKETTRMLYAFADILEGINDEWYENNVSGHAARVSLYTECIVKEMNLPQSYQADIIRAAIMHDMGKIEVDKKILLKQEVLTHEEFQEFQQHCEAGYEIAERCNLGNVVKNVALYHHEQWDGDGYYGLKGDKIPLEARIVALADIYDSIRVERVYHPSYTHKEATEVIVQEGGAMIDPDLVEIYKKKQGEFEAIYRRNMSL